MKILSGLAHGQVLQRIGSAGATARIDGTHAEDVPIRATLFQGSAALKGWKGRLVGQVKRGKFSVKLASIPVGRPYRLRLEAGKARVEIASFFVGDVWILAGQSNMEGVGNMTGRAKPHPLVRALSMRREWRLAADPLHIVAESPDLCHSTVQVSPPVGEEMRRNAEKGVGVGLFFAREMLTRSGGVPQGLICAAHGGTSMQQWSPARKHLRGESLYASMLMSVHATGQPVAGFLWYQGESDANPADVVEYTRRMKKLVAASRRDLGQPRLPWMNVQIARHVIDTADPSQPWNDIQEQQRLLPWKIKFFETVPAVDLPLDDGIHIGADGYPELAKRLASAADRLVYGNKRETRGPQLRSTKPVKQIAPAAIEVAFDFVQGALQSKGEPVGFQVVSPQGTPINLIFRTELKRNIARLHFCNIPPAGSKLHYGHGRSPSCNITDARGFPLPVFGPLPFGQSQPEAVLPFITDWNLTEVVPAGKKLDRVSLADVKALRTSPRSYPSPGFVNEHDAWASKTGQAFFHSRLHLGEPMKLEFLMGYDGPFRLWVDDQPFFRNMQGTNPAFVDESRKTVTLAAGAHDIRVGMDLNSGRAWGFFLRLARKDVKKEQVLAGTFAKPTYSL